jgi:hypothetical protein
MSRPLCLLGIALLTWMPACGSSASKPAEDAGPDLGTSVTDDQSDLNDTGDAGGQNEEDPTSAGGGKPGHGKLDLEPSKKEYRWCHGQPPTPLGPDTGRVCFLTGMAGKFEGTDDCVRTYRDGGSWFLGGGAGDGKGCAWARCVGTGDHSVEFSWAQGDEDRSIGAWGSCFLTEVCGKFEGGGERAQVYDDGGRWYVGGASQQQGVRVSARCLANSHDSHHDWKQGGSPRLMEPVDGQFCALTSVAGKFEGGGEWVRIIETEGYWYLTGSSQQQGVAADALCTPP